MKTPLKITAFVAGMAAVFGAALGVGSLVGPVASAADQPHAMPEMTPGETAASELPGGLMISDQGYILDLAAAALPAGPATELRFSIRGDDGQAVTAYQKRGLVRDGCFQVGGINSAVFVDGELGDGEPVGGEAFAGLEDGGMFGDLGNDVVAVAAGGEGGAADGEGGAADGEGVGLGTAAGEGDLCRGGAEQVGDLAAGLGDRGAWLRGVGVAAGGLPKWSGTAARRRRRRGQPGWWRCSRGRSGRL